ncbi:MAG: hypothetical protein M1835_004971 [Candelina submexicana]|nr:MAG: hypothetical protein M1835_004971 [Candelina submexicana]
MAQAATLNDLPLTERVGTDGYRWLMTDKERNHIASLLKTDTSAISLRGNIMGQERKVCKSCGKHSGLDDLVHNALSLGIHSKAFMLDVLQNGPKQNSPEHELQCSTCGEMFEGMVGWIYVTPWF